jgi:hypothetical protein
MIKISGALTWAKKGEVLLKGALNYNAAPQLQ